MSNNYAGITAAWTYDGFGNRTAETWGGSGEITMPTSSTASYTAASNQVSGSSLMTGGGALQYDAAGNVTRDGLYAYQYDAEDRLCAIKNLSTGTFTGYVYDAAGTRVARGSIGSLSCDFSSNSFAATTSWVLGLGGEQVTEYAVSGPSTAYVSAWAHTNVFANGQLLATYAAPWPNAPNGDTYFALNDWLGTKRIEISAGGCAHSNVSLQFGNGLKTETVAGYQNCIDATEHHFTGKERDTESGNDYFGARYYASSMGRWLSPDPSNWGVDFYNPQTWNHYSYVGNNPLNATDPNGLWLTPTHNRIIDNAFPGLSKQERQILKDVSKQVDQDQSQEGSYKHGMESEDNNPYSASGESNPEYATDDWIEQNEHDAKEIQDEWIASGHTGISPAALAAFGNALHTIADERSPAHAGFQKVNRWTLPWHILREENLFHQHDGKVKHAIGDAQSAFYSVFGTALGDQATHESGKVTIIDWQPLPDQKQ